MATRPSLNIAVQGTKNTATKYNENFELMMDFIDDSLAESKTYVDTYMPSVSAATSGKQLTNNGVTTEWETKTDVYEYNNSAVFEKKDLVLVDGYDTTIPDTSEHQDAVWLYSTPVYPYVPMTTQNTGTSYTFTNGGMVMCTSATNVTVGQGNASITFNGFVGILPVSMGSVVTTSQTAYFVSY